VSSGAALLTAEPGIGLFAAVVLGLVEGITEFLPVSSTGHLILAQRLLGLPAGETSNVFAIGIQMGAITAVLVQYWRRLWAAARTALRPAASGPNLLWQIAVAALPAIVVGLLAESWIDRHLFSPWVVVTTMVAGGVLLLAVERWLGDRTGQRGDLAALGYRAAFGIGLCQCAALVPGTSRSAATIAGALLLGASRPVAAEFSFLVGLPILYGASGWKLLRHGGAIAGDACLPFVVGTAVAFLAACCVVGPFVRFVRTHPFAPFAWYRIVAGIVLAGACACGFIA
jgi:undecaprenyl-diphosphatase